MNRYIILNINVSSVFAGVLFLLMAMSGCAKVSHNGDLDGMWEIMEIWHDESPVEFPPDTRYYYSFYLHSCQLGTDDGRPPKLVGNMVYEGDFLKMTFPYIQGGEVNLHVMNQLKYWGIPESGEVKFEIRQLTGNRLTMTRDDIRIECRKF